MLIITMVTTEQSVGNYTWSNCTMLQLLQISSILQLIIRCGGLSLKSITFQKVRDCVWFQVGIHGMGIASGIVSVQLCDSSRQAVRGPMTSSHICCDIRSPCLVLLLYGFSREEWFYHCSKFWPFRVRYAVFHHLCSFHAMHSNLELELLEHIPRAHISCTDKIV